MTDKMFMKDNRCFICKFCELESAKTNDDILYDGKGQARTLPLCYGHSVEFFKSGQKAFIRKYRQIFVGKFGEDSDMELVDYFTSLEHDRF
jgi:hypothetical protein